MGTVGPACRSVGGILSGEAAVCSRGMRASKRCLQAHAPVALVHLSRRVRRAKAHTFHSLARVCVCAGMCALQTMGFFAVLISC